MACLLQTELAEEIPLEVYELRTEEGEFKSLKDAANPPQRHVVAQLGQRSKYRILVRLVTCVHGTFDEDAKAPATLMIFDFKINTLGSAKKVETVYTEFEFRDSDLPSGNRSQEKTSSRPSIVAFAPFSEYQRFNPSTARKSRKITNTGTIGAAHASLNASYTIEHQQQETHTQRYFDEGSAQPIWDRNEQRWSKIWFHLKHNTSQNLGPSPTFQVAILLKRESNAEFMAKFKIKLSAGWEYSTSKWMDSDGRDYLRTPVKFTPGANPQGDHLDIIDPKVLGKWHQGDMHLRFPVRVYGMDLEPIHDEAASDEEEEDGKDPDENEDAEKNNDVGSGNDANANANESDEQT